jgi:hypothetical protein
MRRSSIAAFALAVVGCGAGGPTPAPLASSLPLASATRLAACAIPPDSYADLAACKGSAEQFALKLAKTFDGKTVARVAIASKDPQAILAAMAGYTAQWSTKADSFTLFAYGSQRDYKLGAGYTRGRIFWNDGGPITVDVCTRWEKVGKVDTCTDELHFTVENQ